MGSRAALEVVDACGLPAVVSSALDTSVGIAAGVALAAALPALDHACGLGTVGLFERDVAAAPLRPSAGVLPPLAGRCPTQAALVELAAPAERQQWWRDRLVRCLDLLACGGAR